MQRKLPGKQRRTTVRYNFRFCVANIFRHYFVFCSNIHPVTVQFHRFHNDTGMIELSLKIPHVCMMTSQAIYTENVFSATNIALCSYLYCRQIIFFATLIVHNRYEIIANVFLFLVTIRILFLVRHQCGHMKCHLNYLILPNVRIVAVPTVRIHVHKQIILLGIFQCHQRTETSQKLGIPKAAVTIAQNFCFFIVLSLAHIEHTDFMRFVWRYEIKQWNRFCIIWTNLNGLLK